MREGMREPELERDWLFVRRDTGGLKLARFDASTSCLSLWLRNGNHLGVVNSPTVWEDVLRQVYGEGYVELSDALRRGLLTKDEADSLLG